MFFASDAPFATGAARNFVLSPTLSPHCGVVQWKYTQAPRQRRFIFPPVLVCVLNLVNILIFSRYYVYAYLHPIAVIVQTCLKILYETLWYGRLFLRALRLPQNVLILYILR